MNIISRIVGKFKNNLSTLFIHWLLVLQSVVGANCLIIVSSNDYVNVSRSLDQLIPNKNHLLIVKRVSNTTLSVVRCTRDRYRPPDQNRSSTVHVPLHRTTTTNLCDALTIIVVFLGAIYRTLTLSFSFWRFTYVIFFVWNLTINNNC